MRTILPEFIGSIDRIRNNFYFSFLSLNFINLRPFHHNVILPVELPENNITAQSLNNFDLDGTAEFENSIRRHMLNDIVIAYERYSMLMFASHNNNQARIDPALLRNRNLGAPNFENLNGIYLPDEITFLVQLRRLRNSIVHYNGVYSITNELNYTFGTNVYKSIGNEGQNISIKFENILLIYHRIIEIVRNGNTNYFQTYPLP